MAIKLFVAYISLMYIDPGKRRCSALRLEEFDKYEDDNVENHVHKKVSDNFDHAHVLAVKRQTTNLPQPLFHGGIFTAAPSQKVIDPPRDVAMRQWKDGQSSTLYSFADTSQEVDPCLTNCTLCNGHVPVGSAFPCLCHPDYRALVKPGDYSVPFGQIPPYEFLIAGAAFQSSAVQGAVVRFFIKMLKVASFSDKELSLDLDSSDFMGASIVQNERGMNLGDLKKALETAKSMLKHKSTDTGANQARTYAMSFNITEGTRKASSLVEAIGNIVNDNAAGYANSSSSSAGARMNIREMMSAVYLLQRNVAQTLDTFTTKKKAGEDWPEVDAWVDTSLLSKKKALSDDYCAATQKKDAPCSFILNVQAQKFHMEHDFSQPFDGWFEWRFIPKEDGSVPQKGPYTKDYPVPMNDRPQTTLGLLEAIGAGYSEQEMNTYKEHLRNKGVSGDINKDTPIEIGAGIAYWNQEDCDCSVKVCQPREEEQACEGGFPRVSERVGGRSVAGPSGTTQKMLTIARFLRTSTYDLYLLRLGLIAWMVPFEDHSLLEILMGAEDAGIPFPHNSGMYSLKNLLPDHDNQLFRSGEMIELQNIIQVLHRNFGVDVDERGPQALCFRQ